MCKFAGTLPNFAAVNTLKDKFSTRLRMIRAEKGLSQENLADMLNMSANGYARIERGETEVSIAKVEEIAKVLEIPVGDLLPVQAPHSYYNSGRDYVVNSQVNQGTFILGHEALLEKLMERVIRLETENAELRRRLGESAS